MDNKNLEMLYERALLDAEMADTKEERTECLRLANEYKRLLDNKTWSIKSIVETIVPAIATIGTAILTFAGIKYQSDIQMKMQTELLASRERQLSRITKYKETDIPDHQSIKLLNDLK